MRREQTGRDTQTQTKPGRGGKMHAGRLKRIEPRSSQRRSPRQSLDPSRQWKCSPNDPAPPLLPHPTRPAAAAPARSHPGPLLPYAGKRLGLLATPPHRPCTPRARPSCTPSQTRGPRKCDAAAQIPSPPLRGRRHIGGAGVHRQPPTPPLLSSRLRPLCAPSPSPADPQISSWAGAQAPLRSTQRISQLVMTPRRHLSSR
jgi:hypothetical protein